MAEDLMDQMYKALRLLPEFDGDSNVLPRFLKLCDKVVEQFYRKETGYELNNLFLVNGILNKITGSAARTLNCNGVPETWDEIRKALVNNFTNQKDEAAFYNDLTLLTQGYKTPQEFYEHCQNLFGVIMTYISLHEDVESTIESKRALYKKLILQSFLRGLNDPLGFRIRCMRPDTIEKALEYVNDEMNTLYVQQRNQYLVDKKFPQITSVNAPFGSAQPVNLSTSTNKPFGFTPQINSIMPGQTSGTIFSSTASTQAVKPHITGLFGQPQKSGTFGMGGSTQAFGTTSTTSEKPKSIFPAPTQSNDAGPP